MDRIQRINEITPLWRAFANSFAEASSLLERAFAPEDRVPLNARQINRVNNARIVAALSMINVTNPEMVTMVSFREAVINAEKEVEHEIGRVFRISRGTNPRSNGF